MLNPRAQQAINILNDAKAVRDAWRDANITLPRGGSLFSGLRRAFQPNPGTPAYPSGNIKGTTIAGGEDTGPRAMPYSARYRANVRQTPSAARMGLFRGNNGSNNRYGRYRGRKDFRKSGTSTKGLSGAMVSVPRVYVQGRPSPYNKVAIFPRTIQQKLVTTWTGSATAPAGVTWEFLHITMNSAFDPFVTPATGVQPLYYDQMKALYRGCLVLASKVDVNLIDHSAGVGAKIVSLIGRNDDIGTIPSDNTAGASPMCSLSFFNNDSNSTGTTNNRSTISQYANSSKFFALDVHDDDAYTESTTGKLSDNTKIIGFKTFYQRIDGADAVGILMHFRVQITQWVEWKRKINVEDS